MIILVAPRGVVNPSAIRRALLKNRTFFWPDGTPFFPENIDILIGRTLKIRAYGHERFIPLAPIRKDRGTNHVLDRTRRAMTIKVTEQLIKEIKSVSGG